MEVGLDGIRGAGRSGGGRGGRRRGQQRRSLSSPRGGWRARHGEPRVRSSGRQSEWTGPAHPGKRSNGPAGRLWPKRRVLLDARTAQRRSDAQGAASEPPSLPSGSRGSELGGAIDETHCSIAGRSARAKGAPDAALKRSNQYNAVCGTMR